MTSSFDIRDNFTSQIVLILIGTQSDSSSTSTPPPKFLMYFFSCLSLMRATLGLKCWKISLDSLLLKHQNKAEIRNLVDSAVISSNFPGLRTFVASMTSTASTTSVASMTSTASFHEKNTDPDG